MTQRLERYGQIRTLLIPLLVLLGLVFAWLVLAQSPLNDREQRALSVPLVEQDFATHLQLVGVSLAIAIAIGLPAGVLLARGARVFGPLIFGFANLSQAVPGVSVLAVAVFIPGLGIGTRPAIAALAVFSVLPILRNTVVGLAGVDESLLEAARGMGMNGLQLLFRVQLPLATPVIFAGLRTALVLNVGTATLATFIGGGGLGDIINSGIENNLGRITLVGAVLVASLALLLDWGAGLVERAVTPRT